MKKLFYITIACFFFIFLGLSQVWAAGCNSGQGKITLDASKSSIDGAGTVWSNNQLNHGQSASKTGGVSLKGEGTAITNTAGSDGLLGQSIGPGVGGEFNDTAGIFTNLDQSAGLPPLSYFDQSQQLFDFGRYNAAANATGNNLSWTDFVNVVQSGTQLYGIVSVTVDFNNGSSDIALDETTVGAAASINIKGTLVVNVINNPNNKKLKVGVPMNVNPATFTRGDGTTTTVPNSSDLNTLTSQSANRTSTSAPSPWPSGYDSAWSDVKNYSAGGVTGAKDPRGKDLSAYGSYASFRQNEDMPALMYTGGTVDIHNTANISGVVYTPGFVEIEQKQPYTADKTQYINGAVVSGNGIFLESDSCGGGIGVIFDPDVVDSLNVTPSLGAIKRLAWQRL